jgi:ligand-binding sensor domain-containing protein
MKFKFDVFLNSAARVVCFASALLTGVGSASALDTHQPLNQYARGVWQTENGLPQNTIHRVIQTRDGYIWVATDGGLARFDGLSFSVFDKQNTPALGSNQIRGVSEDSDGNLWICTPEGLIREKDSQFRAFTSKDGLASNSVWSVLQDRKGTLWIVTAGGLNSYGDSQFRTYGPRDGLPTGTIETLIEDRQGALWIGSSDGLTRFQDGMFTNFNKLTDTRTSVRVIYEDKEGTLWIGTPGGLYLFKNGSLTAYSAPGSVSNSIESILQDTVGRIWIGTPNGLNQLSNGKFTAFTTAQGLPSNRIESLYLDREGELWVSTESGLARFEQDKFNSFPTNDALSSLTVLSMYEDREGNLWLGTESGGLHLLRDSKFETYTTDDGLSSNLIRAVYQDKRLNVWIGTNGGGLDLIKDGRVSAFTTKNGLSSNVVLAICADRNNDVWVGTPDGLNRFRNGKFVTFTSADGLADDFVRSIYQDSTGRLWIGTRRGLSNFKDGKFTTFTTLDGLANDYIGAILEDGTGNLWISTLGGLSRLKDGAFTNYTTKDGLSSDVVTSLYEDRDHTLWIGTNGSGLNRLKDGKFTSYAAKNGLFDDVIYQVLEDGSDNLWISCDKGIFKVGKKNLEDFANQTTGHVYSVSYGPADGMKIRECNGGGHPAGCKTADGKLWFSTLKGVAMTDPDHIRANQLPPPVVIEQLVAEDQAVDLSRKVELAPGHNRFDFHYAALSFVAPEKVQFKYRLEGFDKDWVTPGMARIAYYTNIPPGTYTFRVIACNNDGVWNDTGASLGLYLAPHFYQTYWFYGLCVVTLALMCWQLYLSRVRRIQSQFSAVLGERNRIAREIHDTLAQGLTGISLQLELVAKMLSVSTDVAKTHLNQARMLARECLTDARRSVWDLRSQSLENSDLPSSLSASARRLTENTGTHAQIRVSGPYRRIDPAIEGNLLRIGQEAINNAVKHARAGLIDVGLEFDPGIVRLSVRDDGCGFDGNGSSPSEEGHFGLLGMRERATQIGGKLTVSSDRGSGTEISVEVPLGN